jgi:hypothetical protein
LIVTINDRGPAFMDAAACSTWRERRRRSSGSLGAGRRPMIEAEVVD